MARVTVEDCIDKVNDRFELVAVAAQRAKDIAAGEALTIDRNGEKNTVIALREIAANTVEVEDLREELVESFMQEREYDDQPDNIDAIGDDMSSLEAEVRSEVQALGTVEDEIDEEGVDLQESEEADVKAAAEEEISFDEENIDVDD